MRSMVYVSMSPAMTCLRRDAAKACHTPVLSLIITNFNQLWESFDFYRKL